MPRAKTIPLDERLAQLLALRGCLTLRAAMHGTGVKPPDPKGGAMLCEHGALIVKGKRCVGCKREADRRLYRKRQYLAAMTVLVERGVAVQAGDDMWRYAGPDVRVKAKKRPSLPPDPAPVPDLGSLADALSAASRSASVISDSLSGMTGAINDWSISVNPGGGPGGYTTASGERFYISAANDRVTWEQPAWEQPVQTARDRQQAERLAMYNDQIGRGSLYAYTREGRRIQSDGSLCTCRRCDERIEQRRVMRRRIRERDTHA